jgi:ATP-dependent RNA helicase SUPV3L1/SUV3
LASVVDTVTDPAPQAEGEMAASGAQVDQRPVPADPTFPEVTSHASGDSPPTATIVGEQGASDPAPAAADEVTAVVEAAAPDAAVAPSGEAAVQPELPQVPDAPAEPELIEVWRAGGRSEERRGQRRPPQWQRPRQSHDRAAAANATEERAIAPADGAEPVVEAGTPTEKKAPGHRTRGPQGEFRRERDDRGERRQRDHRAEHRSDRQSDRPERARGERPHFAKVRTDHKDRRDYTPLREREKQADPNSPFAKLAALKAQLEANAKERR